MHFGTNGIRGKFDYLNPELALSVGRAIAKHFKGKILVARDARLTGECLFHALISGLQSGGAEVIDIGLCSSPAAEFAVLHLKANAVVIITASHNPPEWNGIKVTDRKGITISRERGEEIEKHIGMAAAEWKKILPVQKAGINETYFKKMLSMLNVSKTKKAKLKVVLDCGNGMAATVAPELFREMGCDTILVNENIDGRFPGRPSEPSEANVSKLKETVNKSKADCGIAWDGDGDRVIFVDENSNFVIGDRVFALSEIIILEKKKGAIVTTAATSKTIEDIALRYGQETIYTKIGAPYLSEEMAKGNAVLAGEEVGGVIWPELSYAKDGFFTAAKIIEHMAITKKRLSVLLKDVPVYYNEKTKIECSNEQKTRIISGVKQHAINNKFDCLDIDGVRINFDDSWVIIRASGTENYVRVFAESKTREKARKLVEEYKKLAESFL